jgi:hypothetical protein
VGWKAEDAPLHWIWAMMEDSELALNTIYEASRKM